MLSIAYAPILMIQQTRAVLRAAQGRADPWAPQARHARAYPLRTLIEFHWLETVLGLMLLAGLLAGLISLWLSPIVASLCFAVPLSALSGLPLNRLGAGLRMDSPHTLREPGIVARARTERARLEAAIAHPLPPAE